ncbi:indolepyruvate oxidoreductase subunit IorA [Geotalea uraniireducens]|uniref:Indolepyruvate oxidoreductase subunit IorA n=1 Tax=Geotalea uraniireducens TaxID=351604 RepID=A0ABN6VSG0_9BACT|nr:indolepyruvate ferredoxin oxidoreductase subunit alpha [Geotalea uraniireducens]BDV43246.1 indolepyruvate oxidoreductase subunit IorA [Geotalea uraniireducens]
MKEMLSGNEAIARGAYEAGIKVASAYPGTPSTEILENIVQYKEIDASWAPNEKVALEVGIGASFGGARALVAMKHVGVNVAADPLFTLAYTGVKGGLVFVTADDPELHSSQNEQDNRNYARFAKVPMLEPADSQECKDFTRLAVEISEQFDTPVMLRTTTRISHSKSVVTLGEPAGGLPAPALERNPAKYVMLPGNARIRHRFVEERTDRLADFGETLAINRVEMRSTEIGVITVGVAYQYVREVLPEASVLKLGMVWPLPAGLIRRFAAQVDKLYVVEELDPFIEDQVKAMGIPAIGKEIIPICGELTPAILRTAFNLPQTATTEPERLPGRPPNMCPGCPHRGVFYTLNSLKAYVTGDIGCYTLGFMPPLSAMDTCVCMGASIGNATGITKVVSPEERQKVVAVIGDSTFLHSGITGLLDMVYNKAPATVVILDNRITAMTGRQENPASGYTLMGEETFQVDLAQLCNTLGVQHVRTVDPYDLADTKRVLQEEMARPEPSVVITQRPCVLIKREGAFERGESQAVDFEICSGCKACLKLGCPAIIWQPSEGERGKAMIDPLLCTGCEVCAQLCKFSAIKALR